MTGGSLEPASFDASLVPRISSFLTIGTITPRPTRSDGFANAPSGALPCGNWMTARSSFFSSAPSCRSAAATTTGCVGALACLAGLLLTKRIVA